MPTVGGWEWHDLQDAILSDHRERERGKLSQAENEALWAEELRAKDDRILELETRVAALIVAGEGGRSDDPDPPLSVLPLAEIWRGEFSDRLRAALEFCVEKGTDAGWDTRSLAVFSAWLQQPHPPSDLTQLRQALKAEARDSRKFNAGMRALLSQHGFVFKSDNRHSRMEPASGFPGLQNITLMKTPGDHRGMQNFVSQVEAILGITRLKGQG